jgi:hypothetical protein
LSDFSQSVMKSNMVLKSLLSSVCATCCFTKSCKD